MNHRRAISALAALGDDLRLRIYRLLVKRGPEGYPAGEIGGRLDLAPSRLSFHLRVLAEAGLVTSARSGKFVIYAASFAQVNELVTYLTENCCSLGSDRSATCAPACTTPQTRLAAEVGRKRRIDAVK